MQETGIKLAVIQEICELAQKHQIEKVILFGSRARGDYKRASDIDLAVKGGNITVCAGCGRRDVHAVKIRRSKSGQNRAGCLAGVY